MYPLIGPRDDVIREPLRRFAGSVLGSFQRMVQEALGRGGDHRGNERPDRSCRLLQQQKGKEEDKESADSGAGRLLVHHKVPVGREGSCSVFGSGSL